MAVDPEQTAVVLTSGGLRSLVSMAMLAEDTRVGRVVLLHIVEPRSDAAIRGVFARRQADHFGFQLAEQSWQAPPLGSGGEASVSTAVRRGRLLLEAATLARIVNAGRMVWPAAVDGGFDAIARVSEQVLLVQHLLETEPSRTPPRPTPRLDTPLLELSDRQVIELGDQLNAPWSISWGCTHQSTPPCEACPACQRRKAAFESAGMVDPGPEPPPKGTRGSRGTSAERPAREG